VHDMAWIAETRGLLRLQVSATIQPITVHPSSMVRALMDRVRLGRMLTRGCIHLICPHEIEGSLNRF
jgi:hypothetical protein